MTNDPRTLTYDQHARRTRLDAVTHRLDIVKARMSRTLDPRGHDFWNAVEHHITSTGMTYDQAFVVATADKRRQREQRDDRGTFTGRINWCRLLS